MLKYFMGLFFIILISSCGEDVSTSTTVALSEYTSIYSESESGTQDTLLYLNGDSCLLHMAFFYDTKTILKDTFDLDNRGSGLSHEVVRGFQTFYTIQFQDLGGKHSFTVNLTKDDFKPMLYPDLYLLGPGTIIRFHGYAEAQESFMFSIPFIYPESCTGIECFFLINRKGELTGPFVNNYFGSSSTYGDICYSPNGRFILTCRNLITEDGSVLSITNEGTEQVGVKLINDYVALIVQDFKENQSQPNARFINGSGKILSEFDLKGYYGGLCYWLYFYQDIIGGNYLLLDGAQKHIRIIPKQNPLETYVVNFQDMPDFSGNIDEHELLIEFSTETTGDFTFSVDTLNNQFRMKRG